MSFRLAIGRCDCRQPYVDRIQRDACEALQVVLETWSRRLPADLGALPAERSEVLDFNGRQITLETHKQVLTGGGTLVVFQVFLSTWRRPTYLSFGRVGRLYAEGLLISSDGSVQPAPDELMWDFR